LQKLKSLFKVFFLDHCGGFTGFLTSTMVDLQFFLTSTIVDLLVFLPTQSWIYWFSYQHNGGVEPEEDAHWQNSALDHRPSHEAKELQLKKDKCYDN
jgi:hypothetical protein